MTNDNTYSIAKQMVEALDIPGTTTGWETDGNTFVLKLSSANKESEYGMFFEVSDEEQAGNKDADSMTRLLIKKLKEKAQ